MPYKDNNLIAIQNDSNFIVFLSESMHNKKMLLKFNNNHRYRIIPLEINYQTLVEIITENDAIIPKQN